MIPVAMPGFFLYNKILIFNGMAYKSSGFYGNSANDFQSLLSNLESFKKDRAETKAASARKDPSYFTKEKRDLKTLEKFKEKASSATQKRKKPAPKKK